MAQCRGIAFRDDRRELRLPRGLLRRWATPRLLHRTQGFVQCSTKGAIDRHHLACRLHLTAEQAIGARELVEREARQFHHDVVEGGLKGGDGGARDGVRDLAQRATDGDLRRDARDRISGRLAGECRAAADTRVHLDHHVLGVVGREGQLHVAAPLHTEGANDVERGGAEALVHRVGQRLHGGDHDAVARMHAERVDILHGADGDAGVLGVAHHLVFDLLPANEAALDHHLANRAGAQAALHPLPVLLFGGNDAAPRATEGEGGANDRGEADLRERRRCRLHALVVVRPLHHGAWRRWLPDAIAHLAEELTILRHLDRRERRAKEANRMPFEDAGIIKCHRHVECRLSAESGE